MVQCPARSTNPETMGIGYNTLAEDLQENVFFLPRTRQIQSVSGITS